MSNDLVKDLGKVHRSLLDLAGSVEQSIQGVFQAIPERQAVASCARAENRHVEVECLRLLIEHQPGAHEVKRLNAACKIAANLGRMGALTMDLSQRSQRLAQSPELPLPGDLGHVAELVASMVRLGLEAFIELELRVARHIYQLDQEVERYSSGVVEDLVKTMQTCPEHVSAALTLYGAARQLGAIANQATDVAGEVVFLVAGELRGRRVWAC